MKYGSLFCTLFYSTITPPKIDLFNWFTTKLLTLLFFPFHEQQVRETPAPSLTRFCTVRFKIYKYHYHWYSSLDFDFRMCHYLTYWPCGRGGVVICNWKSGFALKFAENGNLGLLTSFNDTLIFVWNKAEILQENHKRFLPSPTMFGCISCHLCKEKYSKKLKTLSACCDVIVS